MNNHLTKYKAGSIGELITLALPLMLGSMSLHLMLFCDRLILAKSSLAAMNAAATVGLLLFLFSFLGVGAASIAEIFAGQHYGAKEYKKVARPIWQMIWFGFMLIIPFTLLGYLDGVLIHENLGQEAKNYFRFSMKILFLSVINTALYAFYISRGKTKIATINTVAGNALNAVLAYLFVFGVDGYLEPQGLMGTAYATAISLLFQCIILFIGFFSKYNRENFDTLNYKINWRLFFNCIKVGLPNGIGNLFEIGGFAMIARHNAELGYSYLTIYTLTHNFLIVFAFYTDGLVKAIMAIASNAIGAKTPEVINKTVISAIKLQVAMAFAIFFPMVIFPEYTAKIFISTEADQYLVPLAIGAMIGTWIWFFIDGNTWILGAVLLSGGDTKFLMFTNSVFSWTFMVMPTMLFITNTSHPSTAALVILPCYAAIMLIAYVIRFRLGKWKHKLV
ncbi:MAG: hypothetical protein K0R73_536 [Candidatus Midichloriaceae bacterium]|jgi:MATE family multidrug resistance protein|nr:hypothetical protein [Candidatus Midichloriaceae bacterium]